MHPKNDCPSRSPWTREDHTLPRRSHITLYFCNDRRGSLCSEHIFSSHAFGKTTCCGSEVRALDTGDSDGLVFSSSGKIRSITMKIQFDVQKLQPLTVPFLPLCRTLTDIDPTYIQQIAAPSSLLGLFNLASTLYWAYSAGLRWSK